MYACIWIRSFGEKPAKIALPFLLKNFFFFKKRLQTSENIVNGQKKLLCFFCDIKFHKLLEKFQCFVKRIICKITSLGLIIIVEQFFIASLSWLRICTESKIYTFLMSKMFPIFLGVRWIKMALKFDIKRIAIFLGTFFAIKN